MGWGFTWKCTCMSSRLQEKKQTKTQCYSFSLFFIFSSPPLPPIMWDLLYRTLLFRKMSPIRRCSLFFVCIQVRTICIHEQGCLTLQRLWAACKLSLETFYLLFTGVWLGGVWGDDVFDSRVACQGSAALQGLDFLSRNALSARSIFQARNATSG